MPATDAYIDALMKRHGLPDQPPFPDHSAGYGEFRRQMDAMHEWYLEYERILDEDFARNPQAHDGSKFGANAGVKSTYPDGFGGDHPNKKARDAAYDAKWMALVDRHPVCALMKEWMWERPGTKQEKRWARALATFGVNTHVHEPMTIAEAQAFANRGWRRWPPVVAAMKEHLGV